MIFRLVVNVTTIQQFTALWTSPGDNGHISFEDRGVTMQEKQLGCYLNRMFL
jgi:hypothetical protein